MSIAKPKDLCVKTAVNVVNAFVGVRVPLVFFMIISDFSVDYSKAMEGRCRIVGEVSLRHIRTRSLSFEMVILESTCSSARVDETRECSDTDWRGKEESFEKRGLQTAASGVDFESGPVNEMERLQRVADFAGWQIRIVSNPRRSPLEPCP